MELYNKELGYIEDESEIVDAFSDDYTYEIIEQNTTNYYTDADCTIKTRDGKYYDVHVEVTMYGSKQDVGDKLYVLDSVDEVTYKEVTYETLVTRLNTSIDSKITYLEEEIRILKNKKL